MSVHRTVAARRLVRDRHPYRPLLLLAVGLVVVGALTACGTGRAAQQTNPHRTVQPDVARLVNPLVGTIGDGNTVPAATAPFGMLQWGPDTSAGGLVRPGGYNYGDLIIRGFSLTHLSGAGCAAFENVPFMPTTRAVTVPPSPNGSPYSERFSHAEERAEPGSYVVRLRSGVQVALAATTRSGIGAFTFPRGAPARLLINPGSGAGALSNIGGAIDASIRVAGNTMVTGAVRAGHFCALGNVYTLYFAARFSIPFAQVGTWSGGRVRPGLRAAAGPRCGAVLSFARRSVVVKVGISYVNVAGALANLDAENPGWNVATVRAAGRGAWNRLLNRAQVKGGNAAERGTFYTALYHAFIHPNVFSDVDGRYRGFDNRVHRARGYTQYANFSGWDVYRSQIPLLAWLLPRETGDMMQSLVADARQSGWLPKWPVANAETGEMDGDSAAPMLAEAYAFGGRHFDAGGALAYMVKGASVPGGNPAAPERPGLAYYLRYGYAIQETGGWGPASETLEYAVDDFAVARMAGMLGRPRLEALYLRRAANWRRLWNPATGFLEPHLAGGAYPVVFNPARMDGYVEGNAYQYLWMVPQDLTGLVRALGGPHRSADRLDRLFTHLNAGPEAPYFWAGNEPGLQTPWVYNWTGQPWRTQQVVRRIINGVYGFTPRGLPGNDDLGTMSAWYVWAAMGLYPEIPGVAGFAVGSPLFSEVTTHPESGSAVRITATGAGVWSPYIHGLELNGRLYTHSWIPAGLLQGVSSLKFSLGNTPDRSWGAAPADVPPSFPSR